MPNGTYKFIPKLDLGDYKVIVVDEVSMLPRPMWEKLVSHGIYILATGDPGQLPPINPDDDNHVLDNPHVFLDEIMRQAQNSEIIRLSMWIREGKPLAQFPCKGEQVQIFTKGQVVEGMYGWADQILCATNNMRNEINTIVRNQKGYGPEPEAGDKIISLRNHWEFFSRTGDWALTNGSIGTIDSFHREIRYCPPWISKDPVTYMFTNMSIEDGDTFSSIPVDYQALTTGKAALDSRQAYQLSKYNKMEAPYDFAYAYAITTHKAQGSEWGKVLIFEEGFPFEAEEHKRWLYTAVTRASDKVVIVRK
jgi:ATP-dependent exoDNAse (exonuclease V) alpha subunit